MIEDLPDLHALGDERNQRHLATQQPIGSTRTWELHNAAINRLLWTPDALTLVGWADTHHLDDTALDDDSVVSH